MISSGGLLSEAIVVAGGYILLLVSIYLESAQIEQCKRLALVSHVLGSVGRSMIAVFRLCVIRSWVLFVCKSLQSPFRLNLEFFYEEYHLPQVLQWHINLSCCCNYFSWGTCVWIASYVSCLCRVVLALCCFSEVWDDYSLMTDAWVFNNIALPRELSCKYIWY